MSKGYVIVACGEEYIKQAYLCALSIKTTQTAVTSVSLITDEAIDKKYAQVFDNVIFEETTDTRRYATQLRSKVYDLSPYDETILLDSDMLFTSDVSDWWELLADKDLFFTTTVKTYRNVTTDNIFYRELFKKLDMPETYVAIAYFKKSELAGIFYSLVKLITSNEKQYYQEILDTKKDITPSFDFTCSLVTKMLDIEDRVTRKNLNVPTFVHLKGQNQNWESGTHDWMTKVNRFVDNELNVFIGNYKQTGVLHYTHENFVTDEIIKTYEDYYAKSS